MANVTTSIQTFVIFEFSKQEVYKTKKSSNNALIFGGPDSFFMTAVRIANAKEFYINIDWLIACMDLATVL